MLSALGAASRVCAWLRSDMERARLMRLSVIEDLNKACLNFFHSQSVKDWQMRQFFQVVIQVNLPNTAFLDVYFDSPFNGIAFWAQN